jgi:hypothetical protein
MPNIIGITGPADTPERPERMFQHRREPDRNME